MPQGKVIAVKPSFTDSSEVLRSFSAPGTMPDTNGGGSQQGVNEVYIGVCRGRLRDCDTRQVKTIVWYDDPSNKLRVGDYVEFKFNPGKTKSFQAAKDVTRIKRQVIDLPGGLLPKVALLASLLLLVAVMNDTRR